MVQLSMKSVRELEDLLIEAIAKNIITGHLNQQEKVGVPAPWCCFCWLYSRPTRCFLSLGFILLAVFPSNALLL